MEWVGGNRQGYAFRGQPMNVAILRLAGLDALITTQRHMEAVSHFLLRKAQLLAQGIFDAVCPRDPAELKRRLEEPRFRKLQRRRGSTEARVAIFKQRCAKRLRCRGFGNRYLAVAWGVLGHNLWAVARMFKKQENIPKAA